MSVMQLPDPNTSAKVICSFQLRYCYLSYAFSQIQAGQPGSLAYGSEF